MADRRIGQNAMAEIENKWPVRERGEDCIDRSIQRRASGQQRQRIEIALYQPSWLNLGSCEIELDHPIQSNGIHRNSIEIAFEFRPGAARKADDFRVRESAAYLFDYPGNWPNTPLVEFTGRQYPRPRVENLHRVN